MRLYAVAGVLSWLISLPVSAQEGHPDLYLVTVFKDGVGYDSKKILESVEGLVGIQ